ncbi:hypothetical protein R3P38DRAFT_2763304 [Favolaschia claudopus]|uniref:Uncharacterized protein n=1 Tax=Favolaschia claudopus TaxID=2862362 RepID=A0AAW0DC46_9AGAR
MAPFARALLASSLFLLSSLVAGLSSSLQQVTNLPSSQNPTNTGFLFEFVAGGAAPPKGSGSGSGTTTSGGGTTAPPTSMSSTGTPTGGVAPLCDQCGGPTAAVDKA